MAIFNCKIVSFTLTNSISILDIARFALESTSNAFFVCFCHDFFGNCIVAFALWCAY